MVLGKLRKHSFEIYSYLKVGEWFKVLKYRYVKGVPILNKRFTTKRVLYFLK